MPSFDRYIGIDYSGAATPETHLPGIRVFCCGRGGTTGEETPREIRPAGRSYWSRRTLYEWLRSILSEEPASLIGIDHGFSFPLAYFERHGLPRDWEQFLEDFCRHWPTDAAGMRVEAIRRGLAGHGAERMGERTWRRLCEIRAKATKSVFLFDVIGSVAKSTHAGLPWLRRLRAEFGRGVHLWPFDGWAVPAGRSMIAEVYPRLWRKRYLKPDLTPDQQDALAVACWLLEADRAGELAFFLKPDLTPEEQSIARFEGWILGVR